MIMNKFVLGGLLLGAFVLGFLVAPSEVTRTETKEVVKVDQDRETNWRALKAIDDSVFTVAGEGYHVCSKMVIATAVGDDAELERLTKVVDAQAARIAEMSNQRKEVLSKLSVD